MNGFLISIAGTFYKQTCTTFTQRSTVTDTDIVDEQQHTFPAVNVFPKKLFNNYKRENLRNL